MKKFLGTLVLSSTAVFASQAPAQWGQPEPCQCQGQEGTMQDNACVLHFDARPDDRWYPAQGGAGIIFGEGKCVCGDPSSGPDDSLVLSVKDKQLRCAKGMDQNPYRDSRKKRSRGGNKENNRREFCPCVGQAGIMQDNACVLGMMPSLKSENATGDGPRAKSDRVQWKRVGEDIIFGDRKCVCRDRYNRPDDSLTLSVKDGKLQCTENKANEDDGMQGLKLFGRAVLNMIVENADYFSAEAGKLGDDFLAPGDDDSD